MSFKVPSFAATDLDAELVDPGILALQRLFRHHDGEWAPPDPKYRNLRVDPPDGHKTDYAVLYTGNSLLATAMECHVLSVDTLDAWTLNLDLETEYSVARYTTSEPGLFLPIDGRNRERLGLVNLPIHKGSPYAAFQAIGLELFKRFGDLAHGLSWASFHRHQPGQVYAIWHHRKAALGLTPKSSPVPLKGDAEWTVLLDEFDASKLTKIRK
jgi:hypothetical protein